MGLGIEIGVLGWEQQTGVMVHLSITHRNY